MSSSPVSNVSISQEENRIICSSDGIYPEPELSWSTIPPSNTTLQNRTTVQRTVEKLYSISSSLMVSDDDPGLTYSCTVRTQRNNMTATISKPEPSHPVEASSWKVIGLIVGALIVAAGIIGVIVWFLRRK
ncbi:hypothetical protein ATANTOWER_025449 [Ataeniobius toweri]|uniref:Ig-like domain-containing protein n=1 Tax=Ataeniobius toweri TaxID=208326 RepID=A0ABU7BRJ5_9TELE|nr:hypothetical protein [Ataeniobius toweri]